MTIKRGFASDNNAGIHPEILKAISEANKGHVVAYGDDPYTKRAMEKFAELFGDESETFFVFNGTGANVLALTAMTDSYHGIICAETAHINVDECGGPEKFSGCKLLPIETPDGKLTVELVSKRLQGIGDQHHVQPKVISISETTELGTVYKPLEIERLAKFAHENGMLVHMDGARLSNASASLGASLRGLTGVVGVDVVSFGGTKNGAMGAEAVVFYNKDLALDFMYFRKQGMQLASKMRFIAAQWERLLTDNLWYLNARDANNMANRLAKGLSKIPGVKLAQKVEANGVFVRLPLEVIPKLLEKTFFYVLNPAIGEVRLMCSFDTTEQDVDDFVALVAELCVK